MAEYIALEDITAPGTLVVGYRTGDPVTGEVVSEWGLTVGEQVEKNNDYKPVDTERPADDDHNRKSWEAYVVGQGKSREDAQAASLDDLQKMVPAPTKPAWQVNDEKAAAEAAKADKSEEKPVAKKAAAAKE